MFWMCAAAHAERIDREKPISFSADTSEAINYDTKEATLSGNVIITQGTMVIHANRVKFRQNPDNSLSAEAYGKPVSFRQKRDGVDEFVEGYALRVAYDGQKELLELFDQALLKRDSDEIRSNYISYHTGTEVFRAEGRPDSTRSEDEQSALDTRVTGQFRVQEKDRDKLAPNASTTLQPDTEIKAR
ncbi:MAG: lipopolysaccharide transport periplasmic protein LptA [Burkholderiales bacterium]|jgi:lipopolysaccharide export system protein LptA|nr:lipopolysaccharide transport periplasmic protein LptA [Burkholderiales bacterium]